jgi:hypothetical protein
VKHGNLPNLFFGRQKAETPPKIDMITGQGINPVSLMHMCHGFGIFIFHVPTVAPVVL